MRERSGKFRAFRRNVPEGICSRTRATRAPECSRLGLGEIRHPKSAPRQRLLCWRAVQVAMHPFYIWIPVIVVATIVIVLLARKKGTGGSGLDDRRDSTEPPELRGPHQHDRRA